MAKMTAGARPPGGLPKGFSAEPSPFYAASVAPVMASLPRGGSVRILLVANRGSAPKDVRGALSSPRYQLLAKAPGVWEATLSADDLDLAVNPLVGGGGLFRWVDLATRFFGKRVDDADDVVTIAVSAEGHAEQVRRSLRPLGFTPREEKPGGQAIHGTISASRLADLAMLPHVQAIEVTGIAGAK